MVGSISEGASKFLGVQSIFAQIFPNLPEKLFFIFCGLFFGVTSKKWSSLVFLQTLGAIFAQIFRDFALIFKSFVRIFRDYAQIFNKSKLLGMRLHPLHPRLLHHWLVPQ